MGFTIARMIWQGWQHHEAPPRSDRPADGQFTEALRKIVLVVPYRRPCSSLESQAGPPLDGLLTGVLRTMTQGR